MRRDVEVIEEMKIPQVPEKKTNLLISRTDEVVPMSRSNKKTTLKRFTKSQRPSVEFKQEDIFIRHIVNGFYPMVRFSMEKRLKLIFILFFQL